ncbi:hypothetical protein HAL1_10157 [Halomonas sp. HAL1]|nr:hypothetical protein HAL1_10157 [Halomonas sp. HAL1]
MYPLATKGVARGVLKASGPARHSRQPMSVAKTRLLLIFIVKATATRRSTINELLLIASTKIESVCVP